jgi:hypothetical protein
MRHEIYCCLESSLFFTRLESEGQRSDPASLALSRGDLLVVAVRNEFHILWKTEDFTAVPAGYLTISIVLNFLFTEMFCA